MTERLLIKGGHVVPGGDSAELPRADVLVVDGSIAAVGPDLPGEGAEVTDAEGLVVMPGLVDSHRHVWQAPLRGIGADMTLPDYFRVVLGRALSGYGPQDAQLATLLGAAEALDAGITTVFDWSNATLSTAHTEAVVEGFSAAGIRAVVGYTGSADEAHIIPRLAGNRGLVTGALAILGFEYGDWAESVRQIALARELGIVASMHAGGGPAAPIRRAYDGGLLGPHLHLVHLNRITEDQAKLLADTGTGVTVTPVVEATMGHGSSSYGRLRDAGARPGLGSDVVVNAPADLFEPMRDTLRAERQRTGAMWPASAALPASTVDGARAIGLDGQIGTLTVGKRADIILVDGLAELAGLAHVAGSGSGAAAGAVVTALGPANVRAVLVDGRFVKRDGALVHQNLTALRRLGAELARRVLA